MPLYTYTIEQAEEWDKVVRTFSQHDVYYLSGYVKAFQIHGDGVPLLFYYESNEIRGINVVMRRDIADDARFKEKIMRGVYFDFATPYGYGGWLIEGNGNTEDLFLTYEQWCCDNNIVSEFVRFHPMLDNGSDSEEFYDVVLLGNTVAMDLSSLETIWSNFTSKNRNMIRKAIKSGVKIYHGNFPGIYAIFRGIYNQTMDVDEATPYYYFSEEFYESILNDLSREAMVFWAELDEKVIALSIMIETNGFMNYHLSGSLKEYRQIAPTNLLLYEAALWGYTNGYRTLHLGGGLGSKEDNLYRFKSAFNRNEKYRFKIGKKVFNEETNSYLIRISQVENNNSFFPKYRG